MPGRVGYCFNGATSSSTWKAADGPPPDAATVALQWGHVVVDVEGREGGRAVERSEDASMGPRRRRRGRGVYSAGLGRREWQLQWGHVVVDVEGQSEPRHSRLMWWCFNGATSSSTWKGRRRCRCRPPAALASMGPRRRRRGRSAFKAASSAAAALLQWGHVVVDVEGLVKPTFCTPIRSKLQWGHVVVDVEGPAR